MKKEIRNIMRLTAAIIALAATVFTPVSCTDELDIRGGGKDEGLPVDVTLRFGSSGIDVETRSSMPETSENAIAGLYVYIFNSDGTLDTEQFYSNYDQDPDHDITYDDDDTKSSGTIKIKGAHTGRGKEIYAIANATMSNNSLTVADLQAIKTKAELMDKQIKLTNNTENRVNLLIMSGWYEATKNDNITDATAVDILSVNMVNGVVTLGGEIKLQRVDTKVTVYIDTDPTPGLTGMSFTPLKFQVFNLPSRSMLFNNEQQEIANSDVFNTLQRTQFEDIEIDGERKDCHTFYMYESLKKPKKEIKEDYFTQRDKDSLARMTDLTLKEVTKKRMLYALREKREHTNVGHPIDAVPQQTYNLGDFIYANSESPYFKLNGTLIFNHVDENGVTRKYYSNVDYTVHLGYKNGDVNDYTTLRGKHYIYHITIRGVKDIIVEVTDKNNENIEDSPGAEGAVLVSTNKNMEFDAHYGSTVIDIPREICMDDNNPMTFAIYTPFETGVYHETTNPKARVENNLTDYKWVKFMINKEADPSRDSQKTAIYAGNQNLNNDNVTNGKKVYDIKSLIQKLYTESKDPNSTLFEGTVANNPTSGFVRVTAFVDEFYYNHLPTEENPTSDNADNTLWKQTVNCDERRLSLVPAEQTLFSKDGKSEVVYGEFTIRQHSIKTFYNTALDDNALQSGWGTETIEELNNKVPYQAYNTLPTDAYNTTTFDGHYNNLQWLVGKHWSDIVDYDNVEDGIGKPTLKQDYIKVAPFYGCLLCNRDLDGDDIIDEEEVRWYQASLDELQSLWIGMPAFNEETRIYKKAEKEAFAMRHYISSTLAVTRNNRKHEPDISEIGTNAKMCDAMIYWAEQYGATCSNGIGEWYFNTNGEHATHLSMRYLRHLGMDSDRTRVKDITDYNQLLALQPQDYCDVTYHDDYQTDGNRSATITMTRMSPNAVRAAIVDGVTLPPHEVDNSINRPYWSFIVSDSYNDTFQNEGGGAATVIAREGTTGGVRSGNVNQLGGYRLPNNRELTLMYSKLHLNSWYAPSGGQRKFVSSSYYMWQPFGTTTQYKAYSCIEMNGQNGYYSDTSGEGVTFNKVPDNNGSYALTYTGIRVVKDNPDYVRP